MMRRLWNKLTGIDRLHARIEYLQHDNDHARRSLHRVSDLAFERRKALQAIADCETPKSNATVRRMARIARDAMNSNVEYGIVLVATGGGGAGGRSYPDAVSK